MAVKNRGAVPTVLAVTLAVIAAAAYPQAAWSSSTIAAAARAGDIDQSLQLIESGVDVNRPEADGSTPLLWAVYNNSDELARRLLDAGADPNLANQLGLSPLLQASRNGDAAMIAALLDHGASLNAGAPEIEPPLMAAARSGSADAVRTLLDAGANPDATGPIHDQTALMWAAAAGHLDAAGVLLGAGADPNRRARLSELTERKNADFPSGGFAALHWAARNGDNAMVRLLRGSGADTDITNGDQATPMMLAIVNDRFDTAALLLELGADPNDGSLFYITVMRDATTDWRARDGTVFRADHPNELSALALTRLLLEAGADPNLPFVGQMHNTSMCCDTKANETPFYRAAIAADVEGLRLMLDHGADTEWKPAPPAEEEEEMAPPPGNAGKSALMVAINGGKGVGVAGGPNDLRQGPPEFREAGTRDPFQAVEVLLAAGADIKVRGPDEETALHVAVKALHPGIVKALVAGGAAIEARNKDEQTALQVVEAMDPPKPRPGFYFKPPPAQPLEIAALLKDLGAVPGDSAL